MANVLTEILRAANKHPNSRVSKLIQTVEEEPSQKNVVLLLIELAEHAEYSIDFDVSLKYYLDLFERLGLNHDLVLNEAGLLLVNSSKIYSKRVDYVQSLVERQILTLSNADDELQKQKLEQQQSENAAPMEKPKRGRKRVLEAPSDPYEVELVPKKFKKLTEDKRFASSKTVLKAKSVSRNIEMEQHIHPAGWQYATIYDLENDEDVDTKRNYKLFTYHVEHRYNTLVPDINFRLHFKVKDYIDEQEEMEETEACNTNRIWPPLSEAYVQKYLNLENYVLQQDIKATKRKEEGKKPIDSLMIDTEPADASQTNLNTSNINESIGGKNQSELEQSLLDGSGINILPNLNSSLSNKTQENLESSNLNGKNDSGLGQSVMDETNNTLESIQLNCTLETSTTLENSNDLTATQANKSLNTNKSKTENDSALGTSILDYSANTDNNTTLEENVKNPKTTTNEKNINDSNEIEANACLNVTESETENCSALDYSALNQTSSTANNTSIEESRNLETTQENSEIFDTTTNQEGETKRSDVEDLSKDAENKKDSGFIPQENLDTSKENPNVVDAESGKRLEIDLVQQQDKDTTQIRVHLPHVDDEGVYLSDVEEHDCGLLSPAIKTTNILPGVERKDVTILMDEELRQALEMRDGIMEHFGHETYQVPVIMETIKQKLIFNIFKLPEKLLRRKVLFKLGPDMDLYLQARSFKRCKPETVARVTRSTQLMQWFSLNNTDMTGISITPPNSPGHTPIFCGFTDDEDDTISCADFCGFTEVEQSAITVKDMSRLSRDSGVGVDANNIVQETLEIVIEEKENSAVDDGEKNINEVEAQTTESILNQLPAEIRDVLTTELEDDNKNNCTTAAKNNDNAIETNSEVEKVVASLNNTEETENFCTQTSVENSETVQTQNCSDNNTEECSETVVSSISLKNTEETEILCTESSVENSESLTTKKSSSNNTQESEQSTESSSETQTCTEQITIENSDVNCKSNPDDEVDTESDEPTTAVQPDKNTEDLSKEKLDCENTMEKQATSGDRHVLVEANACDDDVMLDLSSQGNKTKIQQWHEHLQPILAKSRERHHFDIYKLGTEILDTVQSRRESNDDFKSTSASFHDIMDNKDKSYVSRYFLSTLLLANQSNIEISLSNKSSEKPSSWHDINLKLLSTKRHTVAIEDNIGMIDNKQKARDKTCKQNSKEMKRKATNNHDERYEDEEEEEPLIKLQNINKASKELNITLKRSSDNATTSCIAEKKLKEITFSTDTRHKELPSLIQSVQIIRPPFATVPSSSVNMSIMPSTSSCQASFDVNISAIRTLQPIEKVQKRNDDYDSGIFSIDEMSTMS